MNEFSYQPGKALRIILLELGLLVTFAWFQRDTDGFFNLGIPYYLLAFGVLVFSFRYGYLLNNTLTLGGGHLTLYRRIGPDGSIPFSSVSRFRVAEYRSNSGRKVREMIIYHDAGKMRINISDLQDEDGFIRQLEAKLGGQGITLPDVPERTHLLHKLADRILG